MHDIIGNAKCIWVKVINSNTHKDWDGKQVQIGVGGYNIRQNRKPPKVCNQQIPMKAFTLDRLSNNYQKKRKKGQKDNLAYGPTLSTTTIHAIEK